MFKAEGIAETLANWELYVSPRAFFFLYSFFLSSSCMLNLWNNEKSFEESKTLFQFLFSLKNDEFKAVYLKETKFEMIRQTKIDVLEEQWEIIQVHIRIPLRAIQPRVFHLYSKATPTKTAATAIGAIWSA